MFSGACCLNADEGRHTLSALRL